MLEKSTKGLLHILKTWFCMLGVGLVQQQSLVPLIMAPGALEIWIYLKTSILTQWSAQPHQKTCSLPRSFMSREAVFSSGTMRMGPALSPSPLGRVHDSFPRTFDYSSLVVSYPTAQKVIIPDGLRQLDI